MLDSVGTELQLGDYVRVCNPATGEKAWRGFVCQIMALEVGFDPEEFSIKRPKAMVTDNPSIGRAFNGIWENAAWVGSEHIWFLARGGDALRAGSVDPAPSADHVGSGQVAGGGAEDLVPDAGAVPRARQGRGVRAARGADTIAVGTPDADAGAAPADVSARMRALRAKRGAGASIPYRPRLTDLAVEGLEVLAGLASPRLKESRSAPLFGVPKDQRAAARRAAAYIDQLLAWHRARGPGKDGGDGSAGA